MDLNGVEHIDVSALGGADHVVVNDLSGTDVKAVMVNLEGAAGSGDGQIDCVVVNGTPEADKMTLTADADGVSLARRGGAVRIEHPEPTDTLVVNGLAGVDRIQASPSVSSAITLTINQD
jgi:hypothetical protein